VNPTSAQLRRLLAVLPEIADGQEHAIADVARRVGVEADTLTRDLYELSQRGADPPGWIEKVAVYVEADRVALEAASHFRRPMRLTQPESRALELGLSLLRAELAPDRRSAVEGTLGRVRELATPDDGEDSQLRIASSGTARQLEHVPALRDALRNRRRVAINYQKGSGDAPERRTVCPLTFAVAQGAWYLVAHCDRTEAIRIFRLDRIHSIELLAETFDPPADVDVDGLLSQRTAFVGSAPEKLRVRYSARVARWIEERVRGTRNRDGSLEVEYPLADPEWAVRHVLQYGPEAKVLAPAEVREAVIQRLESAIH